MKRVAVVVCFMLVGCVADASGGTDGFVLPPVGDSGVPDPDAGDPIVDAAVDAYVPPPPPAPDPCYTVTDLEAGRTHPNDGASYFTVSIGPWWNVRNREYMVHVPAGYTGTHVVPVVVGMHGMLQDAEKWGLHGSDLVAKSDAEGFIVAFPNGPDSWNAGTCCPLATLQLRDDVGFIREVVADLVASHGLCVDRERVYATGFSNGGYMAYRLGCEASDLFAAIAPVAGSLVYDASACEDELTRPIPILHLHGDADSLQPETGGSGSTAVGSIETFAAFNGCDPTPVPATLPPVSQLDTTCVTYPNCLEDAETTFCSVAGGGHCWFGNDGCGAGGENGSVLGGNAEGIVAADAIWEFFSRHSCPECGN